MLMIGFFFIHVLIANCNKEDLLKSDNTTTVQIDYACTNQ
jgi:hypothetical protein